MAAHLARSPAHNRAHNRAGNRPRNRAHRQIPQTEVLMRRNAGPEDGDLEEADLEEADPENEHRSEACPR